MRGLKGFDSAFKVLSVERTFFLPQKNDNHVLQREINGLLKWLLATC